MAWDPFRLPGTALTVTTSQANPLPGGLSSLVDLVTHTSYPLTPLISVVYLVIFLVDILYIVLLYSRLKESKMSPWRRI